MLIIGRIATTLKTGASKLLGRFGGGWNWCLGLEAGGRTLIINLLVFSIRVEWLTHERKAKLLDKA